MVFVEFSKDFEDENVENVQQRKTLLSNRHFQEKTKMQFRRFTKKKLKSPGFVPYIKKVKHEKALSFRWSDLASAVLVVSVKCGPFSERSVV